MMTGWKIWVEKCTHHRQALKRPVSAAVLAVLFAGLTITFQNCTSGFNASGMSASIAATNFCQTHPNDPSCVAPLRCGAPALPGAASLTPPGSGLGPIAANQGLGLGQNAITSVGAGRLDVFYQATGTLEHQWYNGTSWLGQEDRGAGALSTPAAVSWGVTATGLNRQDVFYQTQGSILGHQYFDGTSWNVEALGGGLGSPPSAVSWGPNSLDVFYQIANSTNLGHQWYHGHGWNAEALGGGVGSPPTVVSWGTNRLDVFYQIANSTNLGHQYFNGSGWTAEALGGGVGSPISVASWGPNRLDVFYQIANSANLGHQWFDGNGWNAEALGGGVGSAPSVVSWAPNRFDVFYQIANSTNLGHQWFDGTTWNAEALGGGVLGTPSVSSWGPNRLDVFYPSQGGALGHQWWDGTGWKTLVPVPQYVTATHEAAGINVAWQPVVDVNLAGYQISRAPDLNSTFLPVGTVASASSSFLDTAVSQAGTYVYKVSAFDQSGSTSAQNWATARAYDNLYARSSTTVYSGPQLSNIQFPVGPLGGGSILHFGDGTRNQGWIFGGMAPDSFQPKTVGILPNSFFAVRAQPTGGSAVVRALQTVAAGAFTGVQSLTFQGEYPIATYQFSDSSLPISVTETVVNPMIPGDLKNSGIPTAIYQFTIKNTGATSTQVSLLATQQNAVGYDGSSPIQGDAFSGYGTNANIVAISNTSSQIMMSSTAPGSGSMTLDMQAANTSATASWDINSLYSQFAQNGSVSGPISVQSPGPGTTIDGAIASSVTLAPGQSITIPVVLSWYFPSNTNEFDVSSSVNTGRQYTNWWTTATDVDQYVATNLTNLLSNTQLYHDTFYNSTIPQYMLDRISASIAVLHTPTVFWAKNGFFGAWEGQGCCGNMPNHVWHYAQAQAHLWPQIGQLWDQQWFADIQSDGMVPTRIGTSGFTFDGQAGNILMAYRDYLNSGDINWLKTQWPQILSAMNYLKNNFDPQANGVLIGNALTTLDSSSPIASPWLGSMYLAAVNASAHMASLVGDSANATLYQNIYSLGRVNQEQAFWNGSNYVENAPNPNNSANAPNPNGLPLAPQVVLGNATEIDMLLGQWWSTQLGLGDIYNSAHMTQALQYLFSNNYKDNNLGDATSGPFSLTHMFRDFVEDTDASTRMASWPLRDRPANPINYNDETMTGFEYSAAAVMIQRGLLDQGLRMVRAVSNRYDGRLRNESYILNWGGTEYLGAGPCYTVCDGTGNPFGDDEAGKWYGRSLSSWSLLLALQGFSFDLAAQNISFAPTYLPANHQSFFTAGTTWGSFKQQQDSSSQTDQITPAYGSLTLKTVTLAIPTGSTVNDTAVTLNGQALSCAQFSTSGTSANVSFPSTVIAAGATLNITLKFNK